MMMERRRSNQISGKSWGRRATAASNEDVWRQTLVPSRRRAIPQSIGGGGHNHDDDKVEKGYKNEEVEWEGHRGISLEFRNLVREDEEQRLVATTSFQAKRLRRIRRRWPKEELEILERISNGGIWDIYG